MRTDPGSLSATKPVRTADPTGLDLRQLLRRFLDVCNAIDYAHSRGVIHRDLRPANIILGKHGETLVVDWGLAKAIGRADPSAGEQSIAPSSSGSSETQPGSALGTPAYMSPEQASREQAQRRFGLARQAIEQYHTGASEDVLLKQPELEALRKKLLGTSLGFYKRLQTELVGSGDPATRSELAAAYLRVGEITGQVGQTGEALQAYERARAIHEALVQADPSQGGPRRDLSRCLERIGNLLIGMNGRAVEGLQRLESALASRQALAAGPSDAADDRLSIARIHREIANAERFAGGSSGELPSLEQARDVAEQLVADRPGDAAVRQELAAIYQNLAGTLGVIGLSGSAVRALNNAIESGATRER